MNNRKRLSLWALVALLFASPALAGVFPNCDSICGTGESVVTPGADSVNASMFADADWGCASISGNVFSLDASCVTSNNITDLTIVGGDVAAATLTPAKMSVFEPSMVMMCSATCATLTAQGAGPDAVSASGVVQWDTTEFHKFKLYVLMGNVGATTTDLELECDTTDAFTTPTTMVQITQASLTAGHTGSSAWTSFSADECHNADVYYRVVAVGGNGIESPVIRKIYLGLK